MIGRMEMGGRCIDGEMNLWLIVIHTVERWLVELLFLYLVWNHLSFMSLFTKALNRIFFGHSIISVMKTKM